MPTALNDGTYKASAQGYDREINIELEIADGKISDVSLLDNQETDAVIERAFPIIKERIVEANSPDVDCVSAATFSTYAVKEAVLEAMKEAGFEGEIELTRSTGYEEDRELVEAEDKETDLLIIGGGPSGLASAIDAKIEGVENVTIIEKLDILSGNGKFDMNFFDLANSKAMKDAGNEVTKEEYRERFREKSWDSDERVDAMTEGAFVLDEWLRDKGIELDYNFGWEGSMSHLRNENEYACNHIQTKLEEKAKDLGIEILTGTKGVDLILEDDGVKGAKVEDKTSKYTIKSKATVIATGGFSMNKDLVAKYIPGAEDIPSSNQMGVTGDFITIAENNDIKLEHMDKPVIFHKMLDPRRDLTGFSMDNFIFVNENGERFIAESDSGIEYGQKMMENRPVYFIFDEKAKDSFMRPKMQVEKGYIKEYNSVEELAADGIGCSKDTLIQTTEDFNAAVRGEKEDAFREEAAKDELDYEGKLYCVKVTPCLHMTKGGIVANSKAQVLNTSDEVIPGLFATGEVTDTSGAYTSSVIFGRISGLEASKYIKENK
ncbi:FAD-binding protein [Anaerococcus murdochii]|uniref:FAD-binding protein n=1 Tax=Anaerococcus murdochii TaxID=411577 RepID=UPI0032B4B026